MSIGFAMRGRSFAPVAVAVICASLTEKQALAEDELVSSPPPAPAEPAPAPRPAGSIAEGFALDARLALQNSSSYEIGGTPGVPPVAVGYRSRAVAVGVGPYLHRSSRSITFWEQGINGPSDTGEDVTAFYGVTLVLEAPVARPTTTTELHLLGGLTLAGNREESTDRSGRTYGNPISGEPAYGGALGIGGRVWFDPHVGAFAELGGAYMNTPTATLSTSKIVDQPEPLVRDSVLATWGSLGLSFVL